MLTRTKPAGATALAISLGLFAAACSGGDKKVDATTTVPASSTVPASTTAAATTTAAPNAPTTTAAPAMLAALTNLPVTNPETVNRPMLVVKIDNHREARPQIGLNQADVVYEELVEGISRFAAVFQSTDATPVGPVRSARTSDVDIIAGLNKPLFAWSGGNAGVVGAINRANLVDVGESAARGAGGYFRDRSRRVGSEHTLFADTAALFSLAKPEQEPAKPLFQFRAAGEQPPPTLSAPTGGVEVTFSSMRVRYLWDANAKAWARFESDGGSPTPHVDGANVQIAPQNVVVMFTNYRRSSADANSPEAVTVGSGELWVFTDGKVIAGKWDRPDPKKPAVLLDESGQVVKLTPGRTWVELAPTGQAKTVAPEV
ncbi:MAG: DUF3048 domain-containing protein [Acidimicrobiia bacterium]